MRKRWILALVAALALTLAFAGTALAETPGTVISNELTCAITVEQQLQATWQETGRYGTHDGTVYKEFELRDANNQKISLASSNVNSITVVEPDNVQKTLQPDTDNTLWFNVAKSSGDYVFTIVTKDGATYTATLNWTKMYILEIGWDLPSSATKGVNQDFTITGTAKLNLNLAGVTEVGRVLYVIEVTRNGQAATSADVTVIGPPAQQGGNEQPLGYDEDGKFFYWGPRSGFTFSTAMYGQDGKVTTPFKVTFKNTGSYNVKAYAVQLPSS
ncbi:MAG: hypothetical protein AB1776_06175 [Bacillota bacterium]